MMGRTLYTFRVERKGRIEDERKALHVVAINGPALISCLSLEFVCVSVIESRTPRGT